MHTTGRKPHYLIRHEVKEEKKKSPSRIDMFLITHTPKEGKAVNEATRAVMDKLQLLRSSEEGAEEDRILTQVVGPQYPGRVHGYGFGVTPTQVFGRKNIRQQAPSHSSSYNDRKMARMEQMMNKMVNVMNAMGCTLELEVSDDEFEDQISQDAPQDADSVQREVTPASHRDISVMPAEIDQANLNLLSNHQTRENTLDLASDEAPRRKKTKRV